MFAICLLMQLSCVSPGKIISGMHPPQKNTPHSLTNGPVYARINPQIRRQALPRPPPCKNRGFFAGMVELVDSVDLGSTANACRFESCCPHQKKRARQGSLFWCGSSNGTRTHFNAEVRWTSAKRRLDGVCSLVFPIPVTGIMKVPGIQVEYRVLFVFFRRKKFIAPADDL